MLVGLACAFAQVTSPSGGDDFGEPDEQRGHIDVAFGVGVLQLPAHTYRAYGLAWPRLNLWGTTSWGLPVRGAIKPVLAFHGAFSIVTWTRGRHPWQSATVRLEPRGGVRLPLVEHVTLDLCVGPSFAATGVVDGPSGRTRVGPVLTSTAAWLSNDERLMLVFEGRFAPAGSPPGAEDHLYSPGGPGLLVGAGVRY